MSPEAQNLLIDIILAVLLGAYAGYLLYMKRKGDSFVNKYPIGTKAYSIYQKIYSEDFIKIAVVLAASQLLRVVVDILGITLDKIPAAIVLSFFVVNVTVTILVLVWIYKLFLKKK